MTSAENLARFARLVRQGRAKVLAKDPYDGFRTVRAGGLTLDLSPLTWWHVEHDPVSGPVYLAAEVSGVRHPGL